MSIEHDYILRIIKQLVAMLAALLKKNAPEEAHQKINEAAQDHLGLEMDQLARFDDASLARVLANPGALELYAELLVLAGNHTRAKAIFALAIAQGHKEPARLKQRLLDIDTPGV